MIELEKKILNADPKAIEQTVFVGHLKKVNANGKATDQSMFV